ncbi:Mog1 [Kluyveromyces lactis]|nr:Mog1 [Kluyveromyces lactis]
MSHWIRQELYGGAISTVIPKTFLDASMLRQVPDTQEVFVNSRRENEPSEDGLGFDESVIVDLMQRVEENNDRKALDIHLAEISELNGSQKWTVIDHQEQKELKSQTCIVVETAYKWGKESMKETVVMCVALLRLDQFDTDVIISVHVPISSEQELKAMEQAIAQSSPEKLPQRVHASYSLLRDMISSFKVEDPSLFA